MRRLPEGGPLREALPKHTRPARDFAAAFGQSADATLASMNEAGDSGNVGSCRGEQAAQ